MHRYGIEERVVVPAPDLSSDDVMSQSEAAKWLVVKQQSVGNMLNAGRFTVVWDLVAQRRLMLRSEVERAAWLGRERGGTAYRVAPEVCEDSEPDLSGCEYGIERRVVRPDLALTSDDVMTQSQACEVLGCARSTLANALNRGKFSVVWDLEAAGKGRGSARVLLRSEVAQGGREMSRANLREPVSP